MIVRQSLRISRQAVTVGSRLLGSPATSTFILQTRFNSTSSNGDGNGDRVDPRKSEVLKGDIKNPVREAAKTELSTPAPEASKQSIPPKEKAAEPASSVDQPIAATRKNNPIPTESKSKPTTRATSKSPSSAPLTKSSSAAEDIDEYEEGEEGLEEYEEGEEDGEPGEPEYYINGEPADIYLGGIENAAIPNENEPPQGLFKPYRLPIVHGVPAATLHFRGHHPQRLEFFTHFVQHVASAFNVPFSRPAPLPKTRTLVTVPRSPFIFKKSQENFESVTYKRVMKLWDANPSVINNLLVYLQANMLPGVGMRVQTWERLPMGYGDQLSVEATGSIRGSSLQGSKAIKAYAEQVLSKEIAANILKSGSVEGVVPPKDEKKGKAKKSKAKKEPTPS